jgi:hypothetical protein
MKVGTMGVAAMMFLWPAASGWAAEDAKAAFERLKALNGEWHGHAMTEDGPEVSVIYAVTGAGSVVMERLFPGTPHEMVSMYHLDGQDLVMTHYCASGNQPHLRMNPATSSATELSFDFVSGSNMNAAVDSHMHSGRIRLKDDAHIENVWIGYEGGKPEGTKRFILARKPSS